jgi:hypothetical protein
MGLRRNEDGQMVPAEKLYKKPTLKRHGLATELTLGGGSNYVLGGPDSYDDDPYGYS